MKKIFLSFSIILIAYATASAQLKLGLRGGLQINDMRNEPDDRQNLENSSTLKVGYNVGLVFDYSFNRFVYFQPAVLLSSKGSRIEESGNLAGNNIKTVIEQNPLYLEVPLVMGLRAGIAGVKVFAQAGPYLAYGIGGKNLFTQTVNNTVQTASDEKIKWGKESSSTERKDLRRFDMGLTFSAGLALGNTHLGLFYSPGLINISPENTNRDIFNTSFGLNATFFLR